MLISNVYRSKYSRDNCPVLWLISCRLPFSRSKRGPSEVLKKRPS